MTRDSESVESRTACLLKSIASRRVFLISVDVSAKSQNADTSWNIKTEEQLRQWAHDQSNEIIKMNDKLQTNVDHFDNENICIVYVISRLEDDAAEHIFAQHWHDASHLYISIDELFEHLKEIYDELNRN